MITKYRVTIPKRGYIPGVGQGPINRPVYISKAIYDSLKKMGFPVVVVSDPISTAKTITSKATAEAVKAEPVVQPEVKQEVVEEVQEIEKVIENEEVLEEQKPVEETAEEPVEEIIEVLVDDKDLSAEAFYTESFLTSKNICKKILDARKQQYASDASFALLKQLVAESNPDVEIQE